MRTIVSFGLRLLQLRWKPDPGEQCAAGEAGALNRLRSLQLPREERFSHFQHTKDQ